MGQHADFDKITVGDGAGRACDEGDRRGDPDKGHDRYPASSYSAVASALEQSAKEPQAAKGSQPQATKESQAAKEPQPNARKRFQLKPQKSLKRKRLRSL